MRLAAALIAALLLPVAAGAQTMEFGCPDPGTTFTYDSGVKVTAKGRDGMDCLMQIDDGKPYRLRALVFDNPAPDGRDMTAYIDALNYAANGTATGMTTPPSDQPAHHH